MIEERRSVSEYPPPSFQYLVWKTHFTDSLPENMFVRA